VRIVRIRHERCQEWDGNEYMLAPDEWGPDQIRQAVRDARDELIADAKTIETYPAKPPFSTPFSQHLDKTVQEVLDMHEAQKLAYKVWLQENRYLSRSFETRLCERGFQSLEEGEDPDAVDVNLDWGHNHGLALNYRHASVDSGD
jgi:hypothetical protein